METGTFPKDEVQAHIREHFIPVKYESGKDPEQFLRFKVFSLPTFVVLNSNGDEVHRMVGYFKPEDFIEHLTKARKIASG